MNSIFHLINTKKDTDLFILAVVQKFNNYRTQGGREEEGLQILFSM